MPMDLRECSLETLMAEVGSRLKSFVLIGLVDVVAADGTEWIYDFKGRPFERLGLVHAAQLREQRTALHTFDEMDRR
jgi:hypothetical protein